MKSNPFFHLKITTRITLLIMIVMIGMGGLYVVSIKTLSQTLHKDHLENTQKLVKMAYGLMTSYDEDIIEKRLTEEEAKKRFLNRLKNVSLNDTSNFWVLDIHGKMIFHPILKEYETQELIELQDKTGATFIKNMINIVKEKGEGHTTYYWPQDPKTAKLKLSYFMLFKNWDWVIGHGYSIDEVQSHQENIQNELSKLMVLIILAALAMAFMVARSISKPLLSLNKDMQKLASGDTAIEIKEQYRSDEIGAMAKTVKIFLQHTKSLQKLDLEHAETEKMKNEFISVVSHELRTPLTSIRGALGLLATVMLKDLPEKIQRTVQIAYKNSERLSLLINDILDIDKIVSGQMHFDMREESLAKLLYQAVELNRAYAEDFCVRYDYTELEPDVLISCDDSRLLQVMSNLMSNAAKFSPGGGKVEISSKLQNQYVRVSIRDYGLGIPVEFRDRIFKKFSQADSSATRKKSGTGLGLFISKLLVEQMGGQIGYETQTGLGTTFWVDLPLYNIEKDTQDAAKEISQKMENVS